MAVWKNERPDWCPQPQCNFMMQNQNCMCVGRLPEKRPHAGDHNTHNFCVNKSLEADPDWEEPFRLEINKSDAWGFKRLFERVRSDEPE